MPRLSILSIPLITILILYLPWVFASNQSEIDKILKYDEAPFGVVFEVVESDGDALEWALPQIKIFSAQIKKKFPEAGIAVVSHGKEQFALVKSKKKENKKIHNIVQSLVKDDEIPVHICGTHASWYGKKPEDFPSYVTVSPAGPTEINNYTDMGYVLVVLEEHN